MKMITRFMLTTVCLLACLTSRGQVMTAENDASADSLLNVVGYFCKNDTMFYERTQSQTMIQNGDTMQNLVLRQSAYAIIVRDSTADGYTMEYIPSETDFCGSTATSVRCKADSIMLKILEGVNVVFTTDVLGKITGVQNWRQVRDTMNARITPVLDTLYAAIPDFSKASPRSKLESLLRMETLTEAGILSEFKEITKLFNAHGVAFNIGTTNISDTVKNNMTGSIVVGYLPEEDACFTGDYNIMGHTITRLSANEVSAMMAGFTGALFTDSFANAANKIYNDSLRAEMLIHDLEDYTYFYNGWSRLMRTQRIVEYATELRINTDMIECIYSTWPNAYATEDDSDKTSM